MAYFPINNEAHILPIIKFLRENNKQILLPVIKKDGKIHPARFFDFNNVTPGKYNIPEPTEGEIVSVKDIEIVFVPGVTFDRHGGRMGYGKGHYDRFLAETDSIKIGVCYEFQISGKPLPTENHDIEMDYLLTEKDLYEV